AALRAPAPTRPRARSRPRASRFSGPKGATRLKTIAGWNLQPREWAGPVGAERASYPPDARAPTYTPHEWTPPTASPVEGGLRHSNPITPPPRTAPPGHTTGADAGYPRL